MSQVTKIGKKAFYSCNLLKQIEIPNDSQLQVIEEYALGKTSLKCFIAPPNLKRIEEYAFYCCECLQIIEINDESKMEFIDENAFVYSDDCIVMTSHKLIGRFDFNK